MGILLFRVDDRLIHGQVVEGWFHYLHPDCVVVADDEAAGNPFQRNLMELVVPYGIRADILTIEETVQRYQDGAFAKCRAIVLFRLPQNALKAVHLGLPIDRLNLGGLHGTGHTRYLDKGVIASEEDMQDLQKILDSGIHVEVRSVPSEPAVNLKGLM